MRHDEKRQTGLQRGFVYVPSLRRLSSYVVTTWRTSSFEICKQITVDTPVEYHQMDDLSHSPATAALLPKIIRAARKPAVVAMTAEKEGAQDGPTGDAACLRRATPFALRSRGV
jgi:hypothetical protein